MTKRRMGKRFLSWLCVLAMVVAMSPFAAMSASAVDRAPIEWGGNGSFTSFAINNVMGVWDDEGNVTVLLPKGADVRALIPEFSVMWRGTATVNGVEQTSGESKQDFTSPVIYTVTPGDEPPMVYYKEDLPKEPKQITVTVKLVDTFLYFSIDGFSGSIGFYDSDTAQGFISVRLPAGTDLSALKPEFAVNEGAAVTVDGEQQVSGVSVQDFSGYSVEYKITGDDGSEPKIFQVSASAPGSVSTTVFRGRVEDSDGQPVVDAKINWDGVTWATTDVDGSFGFSFDDYWNSENYGFGSFPAYYFMVEKEGYSGAPFIVTPGSPETLVSMGLYGHVDLGVITLNSSSGSSYSGGVTAMPNYTQVGKTVQARVAYTSKTNQENVPLVVSLPAGVSFTPGSQSNSGAVISDGGRTLTLTENLKAGEPHALTVWLKADMDFTGRGFEIKAKLDGVSLPSASVVLSHITLDVPAEIGLDGRNSEAFSIRGEAAGLAGYKVSVSIRDDYGALCETNKDAALEAIPVTAGAPWWKVDGVKIINAGSTPNFYIVEATLKDEYDGIVATISKKLIVRKGAAFGEPEPLKMKSLQLVTSRLTAFAPPPVTNASYVTASIFVDGNYRGNDSIAITSQWNNTEDVASWEYSLVTAQGVYRRGGTGGGNGLFSAEFAAGSYAGYGSAQIYLTLTRSDGFPQTFCVARLTLLVDPSGVVYDADTKAPVQGATATLQVKTGGLWVDWDAYSHNQTNPQLTDKNGAYGWFVPEGDYRVLVSKAGYEPYATDRDVKYGVITVLPPRTDIDIYLTKTRYNVTVNGSASAQTGAGSYTQGAVVTIDAGSRDGYTFNGWTSPDDVAFADKGSGRTTFTMPAKNVSVTADWREIGDGLSPGDQNPVPIITAKVNSIANQAYKGKQIKPAVTVTLGGKKLKSGTDYTLSYGKNKVIGVGSVVISGKGSYSGSKTVRFRIVPTKTSLSKLAAGKKLVKVTWKKVSAVQKITKYEIRYRAKGASKWTTKAATAKNASLTVKSLKKGKTYQFQIRSYKSVSGVKYYSPWSATKTSKKVK